MKTLRRYHFENRDYFITLVTYQREPLLLIDHDLFWACWENPRPFAWVLLPDHAHLMINTGHSKISDILHLFKIRYSRRFRNQYRTGRVWQNRFWDHVIRDQRDFNSHVDYVHFNSVKHGYVKSAAEWEFSSFHKYVEDGFYREDWGTISTPTFAGDFGE
jgi:putative transposase